jgi:hypothetical protein
MRGKPVARVRVQRVSAERLLGSLPDRSIDLVITDAPYTSVNRSPTGGYLRDWFVDGLTWPQIGRVFATARRKLKADGVLMAMTNNDGLREAIGALERAGFIGIRTITWDRQYPGLGGGLRHQCEFVLVGRLAGSRTLSGVDLVSVAAVGPGTANRYPTTKPDGLGRELAAMAGIGPGSLVVDPFCGSGALLVGAAERGATVVAGDVAQRAVELASARLGQAGSGARRSSSRPASGKSATQGKPARAGQRPASGKPSSLVQRPASGKPAAKTAPARAGQRPANGKPATSGKPASLVQRPASGKPAGTSRTTTGTSRRPASGKPGSLVQRPASGKPAGTSRTTTGTSRRPASGKPATSHAPAPLGRQGSGR